MAIRADVRLQELLEHLEAMAEDASRLSKLLRRALPSLGAGASERLEFSLSMARIFSRAWSMEILATLCVLGPLRFNEIRRHLAGISSRALSARLKGLEELGLVKREVAGRPLKVTYSLTRGGGIVVRLGELIFLFTKLLELQAPPKGG
jgi:DNA-binding HxlR family transcriptional regulator